MRKTSCWRMAISRMVHYHLHRGERQTICLEAIPTENIYLIWQCPIGALEAGRTQHNLIVLHDSTKVTTAAPVVARVRPTTHWLAASRTLLQRTCSCRRCRLCTQSHVMERYRVSTKWLSERLIRQGFESRNSAPSGQYGPRNLKWACFECLYGTCKGELPVVVNVLAALQIILSASSKSSLRVEQPSLHASRMPDERGWNQVCDFCTSKMFDYCLNSIFGNDVSLALRVRIRFTSRPPECRIQSFNAVSLVRRIKHDVAYYLSYLACKIYHSSRRNHNWTLTLFSQRHMREQLIFTLGITLKLARAKTSAWPDLENALVQVEHQIFV